MISAIIDWLTWLFIRVPARYVFWRPKTLEIWYGIGNRTICIRRTIERNSLEVVRNTKGDVTDVTFTESMYPKYKVKHNVLGSTKNAPQILSVTVY